MGVLACDRKNCENIMCDRYSSEHGHLCWECFEKLCHRDFYINIENFMNCSKSPMSKESTEQYFNSIFKMRD